MPAIYAHSRMARELIGRLNSAEREIVTNNRSLYLLGAHGPDILFYYRPFSSNPISRLGHITHDMTGAEFFTRAAEVIRERGYSAPHLAYVYGFLSHFALDVSCHGYIGRHTLRSGISHAEMEMELDRALLVADGRDPLRQRLTAHLDATDANAAVIKDFFEGVTQKDIKAAIKSMIRCNDLLLAPTEAKRQLISLVLKLAGKHEEMFGLVMSSRASERCRESTRRLLDLYARAEELAERLISGFDSCLRGGAALDGIYAHTFDSALPPGK